MKNFLFVFVSILLTSCGGKNWDINSSQFNYKNLTEFKTDYGMIEHELSVIQDQEFTSYWYTVLFQGMSEEQIKERTEYHSSYYHAWQTKEGSTFKEFTIASKNECELELHYVVMDDKGKIVSFFLVAAKNTCVGDKYDVITLVNEDQSFTITTIDAKWEYLFPKKTSKGGRINTEGVLYFDEEVSITPVVCLWEKLTIKETPSTKGKYLTSVYQGEVMTSLNEASVDDASKDKVEYIKVRLSDGTEGWVQSRFVAQKAGLGVLLDESYTYSRPGEINKTDNFFNEMDIVAVLEFSDDKKWTKVKGKPKHEKWFKEGWVPTNKLSRYDADVKVAGLAKAALKEEKFENRYDQLKMIADNVEFQESNFLNKVKELLSQSPDNKNATRLKLKWKYVAIDQYGSTFTFVDENEKEVSFGYLELAEVTVDLSPLEVSGEAYDKSPYYTRYETEESIFGAYSINEDVVDKWYWVTFESQKVQPELTDEYIDTHVIIKIEPVE